MITQRRKQYQHYADEKLAHDLECENFGVSKFAIQSRLLLAFHVVRRENELWKHMFEHVPVVYALYDRQEHQDDTSGDCEPR